MVKANAYGIGIERAVPALARAGCETFFVAHIGEAVRARAVAPNAIIYVLNGLLPGSTDAYLRHRLRPVLGSSEDVAEWAGFCRAQSQKLEAAIHVDTGMNRLGPRHRRRHGAERTMPHLKDFTPALLMSHFVSAEENENPINRRQIEAFQAVRNTLPGVPRVAFEFVRHLPERQAAFRPRAARLRALWRQPDALRSKPHASGGRARGPHRAAALDRA